MIISISQYLHIYEEYKQCGRILASEAFWFPFVVRVVLTNHVLAAGKQSVWRGGTHWL